ncbi:MAG: hypothetical protein DMG52_19260 [Acidobacteria bacterium]|nr:MAG: hypothetical protein DMG52_19260 [Acidobacteriota bacterium]
MSETWEAGTLNGQHKATFPPFEKEGAEEGREAKDSQPCSSHRFLRNFEVSPLQPHGSKRILAAHALLHLFFGGHLQEAV